MVLRQFFSVDLLDLRLKHTVLGVLSSSARNFVEEEIFAGTNFRELAFDRENRENFCLAKISRYTVSTVVNYALTTVLTAADVRCAAASTRKMAKWMMCCMVSERSHCSIVR